MVRLCVCLFVVVWFEPPHPKEKGGNQKTRHGQAVLMKYVAENDPKLHESLTMSHADEQVIETEDSHNELHYAKICLRNGWNVRDESNNEKFAELVMLGLYTKQKLAKSERTKLGAAGYPEAAMFKYVDTEHIQTN